MQCATDARMRILGNELPCSVMQIEVTDFTTVFLPVFLPTIHGAYYTHKTQQEG